MAPNAKNELSVAPFPDLDWNEETRSGSLTKVRAYVRSEAEKTSKWYESAKNTMKWRSLFLRYMTLVLTGLAGLLPALAMAFPERFSNSVGWVLVIDGAGIWPTLLLGLAAFMLSIDKFGGFSTGWIRYMTTTTEINQLSQKFEFEWATNEIRWAENPPKLEECQDAVQQASELLSAIDTIVAQETSKWVTEFSSALAELNKAVADGQKRQQSGSIKVTVINDDNAVVRLATGASRKCSGGVAVFTNIPTGTYQVTATGSLEMKPAEAQDVLIVKNGQVLEPTLELKLTG